MCDGSDSSRRKDRCWGAEGAAEGGVEVAVLGLEEGTASGKGREAKMGWIERKMGVTETGADALGGWTGLAACLAIISSKAA